MKKPTTRKSGGKPAAPQAEVSRRGRRARSLEDVVGREVYQTWVDMLRRLVPDGRTHRLAPIVAAMLQYALAMAEDQDDADEAGNSVATSLLETREIADSSEVKDLLHDVVTKLFKDAGVGFQRTSSRGIAYSIADDAYEEYLHWYDMPWE
ncbi:MAG: hypothetical protein IT318_08885 [Anaerolineales bacterium]|nr:hypothetical protein [Anaerolineales bacterium]